MDADRDMTPFRAELYRVGAVFGRKISEPTVQLWWEALCDLPWQRVMRGLASLEGSSEVWPRPIDLRRLVCGGERQESDGERREREQREHLDAEARDFKADPEKVAAAKARMQLLVEHTAGDHRGRFLESCDSCHFGRQHPAAHLHLRGVLVAGDIDWANAPKILGCCA